MELEQKIVYVSEKEMENIKKKFDDSVFWGEISGEKIMSLQEYFDEVGKVLQLPYAPKNWSVYEDWMRDFMWIDQEKIVLIINQYSCFLRTEPEIKKEIIEDFEDLIFPWWNEEVVECMVGGERKSFIVYLVD